MSKIHQLPGFYEIPHTADLAIDVFAHSLEELFVLAAKGMLTYLDIVFSKGTSIETEIAIKEKDLESVLVSFLQELLFVVENGKYPIIVDINVSINSIQAVLKKHAITSITKDIKAVTYHKLKIRNENNMYTTRLVFDV